MKTDQILKLAVLTEKYPIALILTKELMLAGIDDDQEFMDLLKNHKPFLSRPLQVQMYNYFSDIKRGYQGLTIDNIPSIFKH